MMEVIITTEDARALVALVDHFESLFPVGADYNAERIGMAPTGEPYVELTTREWQPSREAVIEAAKARFAEYARGKTGTLFWRVRPEIAKEQKQGWKFYMRLLISDKPWQHSTSSTTPTTRS